MLPKYYNSTNPKKNPHTRRRRARAVDGNYTRTAIPRNGNGSKYDPIVEAAKHASS